MLSPVLFRTLLFGLIICITCPARSWPPSEEDKTRWKNLIQQGKTEELRQLIEELRTRGEDIKQWVSFNLGFHGGSFLNQAAQHGHIHIAQLLIDNGADVNAKGHGYTSVHRAVQNNHPEMLDFLLNQGAWVDGENKITITPLTQAARNGHVGMAASLLNHGASVQTGRPYEPLSEAARAGNTEIIGMLLKRNAMVDGDISKSEGRPLERAASAGHLEAVKQLLTAGAKINLQNYLQETALHSAAENGHEEVVRYLLAQGANIEGEDPDAAPLTEKEQMDRGQVKGMLWQDDDEEDRRFVFGSPMNRAAGNGHISIVAVLLEHGADVRNVHGNARAALQQVYRPDTGVEANFHQHIVKEQSIEISTGPFSTLPISDWLAAQFDNMATDFRPALNNQYSNLINPAVLLTTLDLPDAVDFRYKNGKRIVRIESYLLSTDFIKVADSQERKKANKLRIMFTDEKGKRSPYILFEGDPNMWIKGMERAAVLGARVDPVFFYTNAHHELMDVEYNWETDIIRTGATEFIKSVNKKTSLKNYWGDKTVPSEDVYIPQDYFSRRYWEEPDKAKKDIWIFMKWHRQVLARLMVAALHDLKELEARSSPIFVSVFCLGCGNGKDVIACCNALDEKREDITYYKVIGIENKKQIAWNAMLHSMQEGGILNEYDTGFLTGDALNSAELIRKNRMKIEGGITVVVAEDFLVHQVLPGAYSALQILHQLIQPEIADMVVTGGVHHPLVSERIASAAGWDVQQVEIYHSREVSGYWSSQRVGDSNPEYPSPAFVLRRLSKEQQMEKIYQRSLRRSVSLLSVFPPPFKTLDLSMFGLTQDALEHFLNHKENSKITQIDLSYSYIDEKQLPAVVNLLTGFPATKFVMASGFEPWYPALVKAIEGQQRLKLVQRKDNQYRHELPSLDPDTAKLFGHYQTLPNQRVYAPPELQIPNPATLRVTQQEQATGYLSSHLVEQYHQQMLQVLSAHNLQLQETTADNLCFFNAVSMQLGLSTPDLQTILINQLQLNQEAVETQFPAFAGEQFNALISELQQGQWGHAGLARLLSWIFNKRVVILYFNSGSGQATVQVYNPDGSGSEIIASPENTGVPADLNEQDIILVHNGLGHWLAAINAEAEIDLAQHNPALLNPPRDQPQSLSQQISQFYDPNIMPALLVLLMTSWQAKFN